MPYIPTSGYTNRTTSSAWCSPLSQAGHTTPSWTGVLAIPSPPHLSPFVHWGAWQTTMVLVTERWLDGSAWWVRFLPVLWYVAAQVLKGSMLAVGILQPRTQQRQFPCVSTVMEPKPSNISKYCLCYRLWAFRKAPCFKFMTDLQSLKYTAYTCLRASDQGTLDTRLLLCCRNTSRTQSSSRMLILEALAWSFECLRVQACSYI